MEPLRGGKLVNIPESAKKILNNSLKKYTPAELGLRWLWNQEGVTCVLSGMNSMEMVEENIRIASDAKVNDFTDDVETTTRKVLVPFWYHHKYDRYEYSYLTDDID